MNLRLPGLLVKRGAIELVKFHFVFY